MKVRHPAFDSFFEVTHQHPTTPAATGSGSETLTELPGALGFRDPNEVEDLPLGNVKTKADFFVEFHTRLAFAGYHLPPP